jgi:hypothetical protein
MAGAPISRPPQKNRTLWWILGVFGMVCAVLVVLGLVVGLYFARHVRVKQSAQQVSITSPVGDLKVHENEAGNTTGLPVYPDATASKSGATVEFQPAGEDAGTRIVAAEYFTGDSLDKVEAWYAKQLGPEFTLEKHGHGRRIAGWNSGDADAAFVDEKPDRTRVVAIERSDERVKITLVRVSKREPQ